MKKTKKEKKKQMDELTVSELCGSARGKAIAHNSEIYEGDAKYEEPEDFCCGDCRKCTFVLDAVLVALGIGGE